MDGHVPPGRAVLLEGAGAGPPEDCGGIHGYRLLVAAADPTHPDHRQALTEVGECWGREVAPDKLDIVPFDAARSVTGCRRSTWRAVRPSPAASVRS